MNTKNEIEKRIAKITLKANSTRGERIMITTEKEYVKSMNSFFKAERQRIAREVEKYFDGLVAIPDPQATGKNILKIVREKGN